jgi:putative ubiquitin-RnfH superfamily antitoxin RatB of RatAB toxin-antitoxin module
VNTSRRKRCIVAFARHDRQFLWHVELDEEATIADALAAARDQAAELDIPWDYAAVGIFGERKPRDALLQDGDRVEIYRPLTLDPRERRRQRTR